MKERTENMENILKQKRREKGLTTTQLAKELGFKSGSTITMWENGNRKIPSRVLKKLSERLECRIEDII